MTPSKSDLEKSWSIVHEKRKLMSYSESVDLIAEALCQQRERALYECRSFQTLIGDILYQVEIGAYNADDGIRIIADSLAKHKANIALKQTDWDNK